ncbi:Alpha-mannosidase [Aphelenchoides bicaudatus]|nr:Alpha-mannosidase [Aphelenchoides bicaudatus]
MLRFIFPLAASVSKVDNLNCPKWTDDQNIMNVHIVPHSHDDMGWIKTVDDYYTGQTKRLVNVGVEYIFNTVIQELEKDPAKRFSFAEVGYLTRWLEGRPAEGAQVQLMKKLVENGQIEFISGGWVQPDEAASHYNDMIDQYTFGFDKLSKNFGDCGLTKVAWQIDPFGHSREHSNLAVQLGHNALFHGRMHQNELYQRITTKALEYIWSTSDDLKTNILTNSFYTNNYAPPSGFCFDSLCWDDPVVDDEKLEGYNLPEMIDKFTNTLKQMTATSRHNHYFFSMGSDFWYSNANIPFTSLDRLIKAMNKKTNETGFNVFYSTPSCYVSSLSKNPPQLPTRTGDHFSICVRRPLLLDWLFYFKLSRSMRAFANLTDEKALDAEEKLERAVGLAQHHDAITGTSKEKVTQDYEQRMRTAANEIQANLARSMEVLQNEPLHFAFCNQINESICEAVKSSSPIAVLIFNTHTHPVNASVRIPFYDRSVLVQDDKLEQTTSDVMKSFHVVDQLASSTSQAPYQLQFPVSLPAYGFRTYFLTKLQSRLALENDNLRLNFDADGVLQEWVIKKEQKTFKFQQAFHYYKGFDKDGEQRSGAYIFRPDGTMPIDNFGKPIRVEIVKGKTFEEVRQVISPWVSQTIRVQKNSDQVEFEFLNCDLKSSGVFYTDANGRQMMRRELNNYGFDFDVTEPIAGWLKKALELLQFNVDDSWGVEEPLDEPGSDGRGLVISGKHLVQLGSASSDHRLSANQFYHEPILAFAPIPNMTGLVAELPPQVKILTLKMLSGNKLLLRLEHIYQTNENDQVVNVDLTTLFKHFNVIAVDELMLGANKAIGRLSHWDSRTIKLTPMQIRTFELTVTKQA